MHLFPLLTSSQTGSLFITLQPHRPVIPGNLDYAELSGKYPRPAWYLNNGPAVPDWNVTKSPLICYLSARSGRTDSSHSIFVIPSSPAGLPPATPLGPLSERHHWQQLTMAALYHHRGHRSLESRQLFGHTLLGLRPYGDWRRSREAFVHGRAP